jgi:hypothetical protein
MSKKLEEEEQTTVELLKRLSDALGHQLTREQVAAVYALSRAGANPEGIAMALKAVTDAQHHKREENK